MRMDRKVNIPFRTQQFIVVAARMGSFHKAAASLGVDHSLVVRTIDRLERDLGVKIFDRDRSHFAVTHAGSFFIREIMEAVDRVDRACDLARYRSQIDHGPLRLGYSAYIHSRLIPILERWQPSSIPAGKQQRVGSMKAHIFWPESVNVNGPEIGTVIASLKQNHISEDPMLIAYKTKCVPSDEYRGRQKK